jgi:hypothetical protein
MRKLFSLLAAIAALGILLSQPAFAAKLNDKGKQSAGPTGSYTCKSGKIVHGKKGCKEYGGSN